MGNLRFGQMIELFMIVIHVSYTIHIYKHEIEAIKMAHMDTCTLISYYVPHIKIFNSSVK